MVYSHYVLLITVSSFGLYGWRSLSLEDWKRCQIWLLIWKNIVCSDGTSNPGENNVQGKGQTTFNTKYMLTQCFSARITQWHFHVTYRNGHISHTMAGNTDGAIHSHRIPRGMWRRGICPGTNTFLPAMSAVSGCPIEHSIFNWRYIGIVSLSNAAVLGETMHRSHWALIPGILLADARSENLRR